MLSLKYSAFEFTSLKMNLLFLIAFASLCNFGNAFVPQRPQTLMVNQRGYSAVPFASTPRKRYGILKAHETLENSASSSSELIANNNIENAEEEGLSLWASRGILLLVAAIWGTNFASVKYLETLCFHPPCNHPASEFAFARFGLAAVISLPLLFRQRADVVWAGMECGLWITLGYVSQALALADNISSGKCAFICSLTVVVVPVMSALIYGKPVKPLNIVAAAIALTGVGVLEGLVDVSTLIAPAVAADGSAVVQAATTVASSSSTIETAQVAAASGPIQALANALGVHRGDILALGQPIGFGYTFCRIEHYQEVYKDVPNRVLTIAAAQCFAVGLTSLIWVLMDYQWQLPNMEYLLEPHRMATIAWTGVVTTVGAIFLEGIALQRATATDAAISFASEPVWASLFGLWLLHEHLSTTTYVGGAIIMAACLVGALTDDNEEEGDIDGASIIPDVTTVSKDNA